MKINVQHQLLFGFLTITLVSSIVAYINYESLHRLSHNLEDLTGDKIGMLESALYVQTAADHIIRSKANLDQENVTQLPARFKIKWNLIRENINAIPVPVLKNAELDSDSITKGIDLYLADISEVEGLLDARHMILEEEHALLLKLDKLEPAIIETINEIQAYFDSAGVVDSPLYMSSMVQVKKVRDVFHDMPIMAQLNQVTYNLNSLYQVMLRVISATTDEELIKLQLQIAELKHLLDDHFAIIGEHHLADNLEGAFKELLPFVAGKRALLQLKRRKLRFSGLIELKLRSHLASAEDLSPRAHALVTQIKEDISNSAAEMNVRSQNASMSIVLSTLGSLLFSFIIVYGFIGKRIAGPIRQTSTAMLDIVQGRNAIPLDQKRDDEIGDMARALDVLSTYVHRTKEAEHAKDQQQMLLNTILDSINALILVRSSDREVILANNYCQRVDGWQDLDCHPNRCDCDKDNVEPCQFREFEESLTLDNGRKHDYLTQLVPLVSESGKCQGMIRLSTNISQQKSYEQKLAIAKSQAEASTQAKSDFLATMSHEIRTPLNGVLGTIEMLSLTDMNFQQREYMSTINESSQSLLSIINDILDFSKIEAGKMDIEPVAAKIRGVVEGVAQLHTSNLKKSGVDIRLYISPLLSEQLVVDDVRLRQIVGNLVSNAVKFTKRGYIAIEVDVISDTSMTQSISIAVSDSGIGISEETKERLFEHFTQAQVSTTREYGGTGLGLAICHRLCELMSIKLDVESEPNVGSKFILTMELAKVGSSLKLRNNRNLPIYTVGAHTPTLDCVIRYLDELNLDYAVIPESEGLEKLSTFTADHGLFIIDFSALELLNHKTEKELEDWLNGLEARILVLHPNRTLWTETQTFVVNNPLKSSLFMQALKVHLQSERSELTDEHELPQALATDDLSEFHILVAEDNPVNQKLIANQLNHFNLSHSMVDNGQEALLALISSWNDPEAQQFDAVLTDCHMPLIDGYQLAAEIRNNEKPGTRIPIIALTANALVGESKKCLEVGMDDFLSKPVKLLHFNAVLSKWLRKGSARI
ncbi:ATP-binding protein [Vibrio hannami]|uniref:hybrid sensor histidine kinase/response regulator n=1 Tax=Vibrio hannami TaxID=2717094 RepID=UPI00241017F1|nr:hybrid sensor histidine kinase/response regulator [Vibrio hannami]MDG3087861.1 ATP-binding protein [Vibrio hannami]